MSYDSTSATGYSATTFPPAPLERTIHSPAVQRLLATPAPQGVKAIYFPRRKRGPKPKQ